MRKESGFTLIECVLIFTIMAVLGTVAILSIKDWLPRYRLKNAAQELYSNMQLAKLEAVKQNKDCAITFNVGAGTYTIDLLNKTVDLNAYGDGVKFECANPADDPVDDANGSDDVLKFNPRGTCEVCKVYLTNNPKSFFFMVKTQSTGFIDIQRL